MDQATMLRRQVELTGVLRTSVTSSAELLCVYRSLRRLHSFFKALANLSKTHKIPADAILQCLLQWGAEGDCKATTFDGQHGDGNIPMHQAKVLDRRKSLQLVASKLNEAISFSTLRSLVGDVTHMREVVRVKVEDANDLAMVQQVIEGGVEYLNEAWEKSKESEKTLWAIFCATSKEELSELVGASNDSPAVFPPIPPQDLRKAIVDEVTRCFLSSRLVAIGRRVESLNNISRWLKASEETLVESDAATFVSVLADPLKHQLKEQRSAIFLAACEVVTALCVCVVRVVDASMAKLLTTLVEPLVLKLQVSSATIADAAEASLRELTLTISPIADINVIFQRQLAASTHAERRMRILRAAALATLRRPGDISLSRAAAGLTAAADHNVRQSARIVCILLERDVGNRLMLDESQRRAVESERRRVENAAQRPQTFEVAVGGCKAPSQVAGILWGSATAASITAVPSQIPGALPPLRAPSSPNINNNAARGIPLSLAHHIGFKNRAANALVLSDSLKRRISIRTAP